ncbi:MAG: hypothetical protein ACM3XM_12480, partial [Mycobacterium leprae]
MSLFQRTTIRVTVLGLVGTAYVRWEGSVRLFGSVTLKRVLAAASRPCHADLLAALAATDPCLLVNDERCTELTRLLHSGDTVT